MNPECVDLNCDNLLDCDFSSLRTKNAFECGTKNTQLSILTQS